MKTIPWDRIKTGLTSYFDLSEYLIPQADAEQAIREGVSFRGINIIILIVAIFIASLGLNTNSTAVIIGAMLISPLMGPIIGIGLAVGIHDFDLMKRSFRNLMMATLFSVATSCLYFLISPVSEGHSELLARTSPTIYDVFIGFFGGAAGILAIGSKVKGNVIPGVAIATALMPPLCTVGYGLATWQMSYFFGALFLFFINSVFIACATTVGVKLMKYRIKDFSNPVRARRVRDLVYGIAILTMIPACYLTFRMYRQSTFQTDCQRFVDTQFDFPDTQVLHYTASMEHGDRTLTVSLIGRAVPRDSLLLALTDRLPDYGLGGTRLRIIQGDSPDFDATTATSTMLRDMYQVTQNTINTQRQTIDSLRAVTAAQAHADTIGAALAPELRVIFPEVKSIAITRAIVSNTTPAHSESAATPASSRPKGAGSALSSSSEGEARGSQAASSSRPASAHSASPSRSEGAARGSQAAAMLSSEGKTRMDTINVALVRYATPLPPARTEKFRLYLQARLNIPSILIVPTPNLP